LDPDPEPEQQSVKNLTRCEMTFLVFAIFLTSSGNAHDMSSDIADLCEIYDLDLSEKKKVGHGATLEMYAASPRQHHA